jgi:hypothetical protein
MVAVMVTAIEEAVAAAVRRQLKSYSEKLRLETAWSRGS